MFRCKLKQFCSEHSVIRIISTVKKLYDHNKLKSIYNPVKAGLQCLRRKKSEEFYFANGKTSNFQKGTNILHHFYDDSMVAVLQIIMFVERHFIYNFSAPGALV